MRVKEFGLNPATCAGLTSDGASIMVAAGRDLKVIYQTCLGICVHFKGKIPESWLLYEYATIPLIQTSYLPIDALLKKYRL
jgi:hypothetical protein